MKKLVIMPGGFHPFHAGHMALYNSAVKAFPDADVYVAATNDTSNRPFPFSIKEKFELYKIPDDLPSFADKVPEKVTSTVFVKLIVASPDLPWR